MSKPKTLEHAATSPDVSRPESLFRNRGFLLLWAAYGVSAMGDHISEMAVLKWLDALHAPNLTQLQAMMTFMFMAPFFVLGPITGMLADRLPRRGIMVAADVIRAIIMLNFGFLMAKFVGFGSEMSGFGPISRDVVEKLFVFVPLMCVGVFAACFSPARIAFMPELIRPQQLVRANAMNSGLGVIGTMIAAVIGGYLASHYAAKVAFRVDAATFVLSACLLLMIRPPASSRTRTRSGMNFAALREAVSYVTEHKRVIQLIGVAVIVWICGASVRATMPAMVRDIFNQPDYFQISLFQLRLGLGMLSGAILLTLLGSAMRSEVAMTWSLLGISCAIGLLASMTVLPISSNIKYHIGGVAIILAGVFAAGAMASYNALMQRILPNRLRGRVFGLTDLCTMTGLLLATGLIGIPEWEKIDAYIGHILFAVTAAVGGTAIASLLVRWRSGRMPARHTFWWNFNEFYCKWWFRLRREGICSVPGEGPVIVVANHVSSIDPLLLSACIPNRLVGFMVAQEYYNIPLGKHLVKMLECIPVRRDGTDAGATKAALRHLKAGKALGIFIEGGIRRPEEVEEAKEGAALLAARTGAIIVPAGISGTQFEESVVKSFFRRQRAVVRFGKPMKPETLFSSVKPSRDELRDATARILQEIRELGGDGA